MQGSVREIAADIVTADGRRLPVLVNSVLVTDDQGEPRVVRTTVFDATERRAYERELLAAREGLRNVSLTLQHSLMGPPLPDDPRFEIEALYQPAEAQLEVGGDWYDTFELPDGKVGIVVGDVVGRGLSAAAAMGQLRSAVRALALAGLGPAAVDPSPGHVRRPGRGDAVRDARVRRGRPGQRRRHVHRRRAPAAGAVPSAAGVHGGPLDAAGRQRRDAAADRGALHARAGRRVRALHRRPRRAPDGEHRDRDRAGGRRPCATGRTRARRTSRRRPWSVARPRTTCACSSSGEGCLTADRGGYQPANVQDSGSGCGGARRRPRDRGRGHPLRRQRAARASASCRRCRWCARTMDRRGSRWRRVQTAAATVVQPAFVRLRGTTRAGQNVTATGSRRCAVWAACAYR